MTVRVIDLPGSTVPNVKLGPRLAVAGDPKILPPPLVLKDAGDVMLKPEALTVSNSAGKAFIGAVALSIVTKKSVQGVMDPLVNITVQVSDFMAGKVTSVVPSSAVASSVCSLKSARVPAAGVITAASTDASCASSATQDRTNDVFRRLRAKPDKKIVDHQAAIPSS